MSESKLSHLWIGFEFVPHLPKVLGKDVFGDGFAVDPDALSDGNHVRRGVQTDSRIGRERREERGRECARRSFPFRARNVQDVEAVQIARLRSREQAVVVGLSLSLPIWTGAFSRAVRVTHSVPDPFEVLDPLDHLGFAVGRPTLPNRVNHGRVGLERVERVDRGHVGSR